MKKLYFLYILVFTVMVAMLPQKTVAQSVSVWDGTSAIWTQGSGTEADPYLIETAQNLAWISEMVNNGVTNYSGVWFKLTTDLNMHNIAWVPIGNSTSNCFCGKFNGDTHFIDSVSVTGSYTYAGLFGITGTEAHLLNIGVHCNVDVNGTGDKYSGGIIGYINGENTLVENCYNTGSISSFSSYSSSSSGYTYSGGIVGYIYGTGSMIINSYNTGNVTSSHYSSLNSGAYPSYSGGVVGSIYGTTTVINKCYNIGNVSSSSRSTHSSGGIVGYINGTISEVINCYNAGNIISQESSYSSSYIYSGGIVGSVGSTIMLSDIKNCYNVGNGYALFRGAICGSTECTISNCYFLETSGGSVNGGTPKTEAAMKSPSFPVMLNADSIVFVMDITPNVNNGYPIFGEEVCKVLTRNASEVGFASATLNGTYTPRQYWLGGAADVVGFEYKKSTNTSYSIVYSNVGSPAEYQLTGLQNGTSYDYRFFIQKNGVTYYGNNKTFTTLACDLQATVTQSANQICAGDTATFMVTASSNHSNLFTYEWNNGSTGNTINVNDTSSYTVTVHDTNGCVTTATALVVVNPVPQGIISGNTLPCFGESTTLTASGANSYSWNTGATTPVITVNNSGDYTCTFTNSYSCTSTQTVTVNVVEEPIITGNFTFCNGDYTTLTASGGDTYLWNNGATSPAINVNVAGTYSVTVSTSNGCIGNASVSVLENQLPEVNILGNAVICSGIGTTLTASSGTNYLWSNGSSLQSITANNPGTYSVTVSNAAGCTNTASIDVSIMDNVTISGVSSICEGQSTTLFASGEGNYMWSNGVNTSFITVNTPGNYTVTVTLPNGCSSSASIEVVSAPNPTPSISGSTTLCQGQTTILTANGGNSYLWSNGSTTNNISISQSGAYTVTVTNVEGCSASANVTVVVNPLPNVSITGSNSFCQGDNTTLTAIGASTYVWNNSSTVDAITVNAAGTYIVTGTDVNGCTNTAAKTVYVSPTYNTVLTHNICQGESYNFHGQNLTMSGTYTHTLQTVNGCDSVLTLTLTVIPQPNVTITGNTSLCEGQSTVLTANGGVSYVWNNTSTSISINVAQSGVYTVTATNVEGCTATANATVTVNSLPIVVIGGNTSICEGGSTTLTASGADTYSWSTGDNTASATINAFGIYNVTGTSAAGCSSVASVTVLVSQLPIITITGETDICAGESTTLTANGGTTYIWSNGTTDATLTVSTAGTWQVIGYNEAGCSAMVSTTVNIWQPTTSEFSVECPDSCYTWNDQDYCTSGDYTQTLQTVHGCDSVVTLHLTITVGIEDYDFIGNIVLYPNPTSQYIDVRVNGVMVVKGIEVYDMYGKIVRVSEATRINVADLADGIYLVRVATNKGTVTKRFVKNR